MTFHAKFFDELTNSQLYEILRSRAEVFVVEQKIRYVDEDGIDRRALHCFLTDDSGRAAAYLRAYSDGGRVKIGRVLTIVRGEGLGLYLMERSVPAIFDKLNCRDIFMDAQKHAVGFYEKCGFSVTSEEFLEEGIVHVEMALKSENGR